MKSLKLSLVVLLLFFSTQLVNAAPVNNDQAITMFKNYVNSVVQKVEKADDPKEKRATLNHFFDKMITVLDRVEGMGNVSGSDKKGIISLKKDIQDKKDELNGKQGYDRVPDQQLNQFAHYVQQDVEQAEQVTITISLALLVIIIILLVLI